MRKILIIILSAVLGITGLYFGIKILNNESNFIYFPEKKTAISNPADFSILILGDVGTGNGGKWHTSPALADAIFLAVYKSETETIDFISLPRDLFINLDGESFKLNEVIKRKKINSFLEKLPEITSVKTKKYAIVNLGLVKKVIDLLGGVDVKLNSDIIDSVSGYRMKAGDQHLSGEDVAWIIRNRFASEGDFFREKNQHLILAAALEKYRNLSGGEKLKFLIAATTELGTIESNISPSDILPFIQEKGNLKTDSIVLDFKTGLVQSATTTIGKDTAYILLPSAGINNYEKIKEYIESKINYENND